MQKCECGASFNLPKFERHRARCPYYKKSTTSTPDHSPAPAPEPEPSKIESPTLASQGALSPAPAAAPSALPSESRPPLVSEGKCDGAAAGGIKRGDGSPEVVSAASVTPDGDFPSVVVLNVGGVEYITKKETLRKYKGSMLERMFSGDHPLMLDGKKRYFINRNGEVFKYILDYLIYDIQPNNLPPYLDKLFHLDIKHYGLVGTEGCVMSASCPASVSNGGWFSWNARSVPESNFMCDKDTITVIADGYYEIFMMYVAASSSGKHYVELYVDNSVTSRVYHSQYDRYYQSRLLHEYIFLRKYSTLKFKYTSNSPTYNSEYSNYLTIRFHPQDSENSCLPLVVRSTSQVSKGSYLNWNKSLISNASLFNVGSDSITILKNGVYQIFLSYVTQTTANGNGSANVDLLLNNSAIKRVYHGQNDGLMQSRVLSEIASFNQNDTLKVLHYSNYNANPDEYSTSLTIIPLKSEKLIWMSVQSTSTISSGYSFKWDEVKNISGSHFSLADKTKVKILKPGKYQIYLSYTVSESGNGEGAANVDLLVSGQVHSRVFQGSNNGYQQSRQLHQILYLQENDTVEFKFYSSNSTLSDKIANFLYLVLLE